MRAVLGRVTQVLMWLVILAAAAVLVVAVLLPRVAGATPYAVLTGSMRPHYPPGTLVVVRPTPFDELRVGDVVTYQLESGRPQVVTHRIVELGTDLDGKQLARTRGDANDVADREPVRDVQIRGRLWYAVPWLGYANGWLPGSQRQLGIYLVAGVLLGYAAVAFVGAARDRRVAKTEDGVEQEVSP